MITSLKENQIFVFGSNLAGNHAGGAARQALSDFGALPGIGEGLHDRSYAFPTLGIDMKKVSEESLLDSIKKLYLCCKNMPDYEFLLTKVGCGIAGFSEQFMKSLFVEAPKNLIKPQDWN